MKNENVNKVIGKCMSDPSGLLGQIRLHMITTSNDDIDPYKQYQLYRLLQWSYWVFAGMVSVAVAGFPHALWHSKVFIVHRIIFGIVVLIPLQMIFWDYAKNVLPKFWGSRECFKSIEDLAVFLFPGETNAVKIRRLHHNINFLQDLTQALETRLAEYADNVIALEHEKGRMCGISLMEQEKARINLCYEIVNNIPFSPISLIHIKKLYQEANARFEAKLPPHTKLVTTEA